MMTDLLTVRILQQESIFPQSMTDDCIETDAVLCYSVLMPVCQVPVNDLLYHIKIKASMSIHFIEKSILVFINDDV